MAFPEGRNEKTEFKPGQSGNPAGRPKGLISRKTILEYFLFEADIDKLGIVKNKPAWWDDVKPKKIYEVMTIAMAQKAMSGDDRAFNAINRALGENIDLTSAGEKIEFVNQVPRVE